jgi:hypothetical protein
MQSASRPSGQRRSPQTVPQRRGIAAVVALVAASWGAEAPAITAEFADRWIGADSPLVLRIDAEEQQHWRRWRVFIGHSDITALLRLQSPGKLVITPTATRWAQGEGELIVYDGEDWSERLRTPVRVLSAGGFERSAVTPRLGLQLAGRAAERRSDGQPVSARGTFSDLGISAGTQWEGTRNGWTMNAAANLSGSSHRPSALRAGELGADAPKLDLADYTLAFSGAGHSLQLGHLSANAHPLLAQGLSSRGVGLRSAIGPGMDVAVNVLNGTTIVGWDNLSGLEEADHQARLMTFGLELIPSRPSALRAELSVIDASLQPRTGFNTGSVADAEQSRGFGMRLVGASEGGRVSGELALARSRFANPFDPALALDGELRAVQPVTRTAMIAAIQLGLLRQWPLAGRPLDLTLDLRHERAAPQYRSLAAYVTPDQALSRAGLQAAMAGASAQLQLVSRVDNLDRIATLLRTRTDEWNLALNLPLPSWWGAEAGTLSPWPALSWTSRHAYQRAVNAPVTEDSGFAASQRPDQIDRAQQLNLTWALPVGNLSYGLARSSVDNRQPGRERADFRRLAHQIGVDGAVTDSLRLALALQRSRQLSIETGLVNWSSGGSLQVDWQVSEIWALSAAVNYDLADDSLDQARLTNQGAHLQLTRQLKWHSFQLPVQGQAFVRLARQDQRQSDSIFALHSAYRSSWVDFGFSVAFF